MPSLLPMDNSTDVLVHGWMPAPDRRGTGDVLWSCGMTILLCCWVSVYPNVGSPSDKWYHPFLDKLNLFCIALLGPDFLFGIAFGQWSKARESVKVSDLRLEECTQPYFTYSFCSHTSLDISNFKTTRRHETRQSGNTFMLSSLILEESI